MNLDGVVRVSAALEDLYPCDPSGFEGFVNGAAVAFGLIGMAEAIGLNAPLVVERDYWTSEINGAAYYDCFCPGCGVRLKFREPGVHEGTDLEWCGACRDSF